MIGENIKDIYQRIKTVCNKCGRDPGEITLVCVTKGIDPYRINEVAVYGVKDIGENRVQEAQRKKTEVLPGLRWHLIGHLQSNKVKEAIRLFELIHSVDTLELAKKIDKEARKSEKKVEILVQVNTSGEESKYGLYPQEVTNFISEVSRLEHIKVKGLMTITPLVENPETVRPYLRQLREIFEDIKNLNIPNIDMEYLSMGMSQDFEIAIQEGSNMLRIGRAIFEEQ